MRKYFFVNVSLDFFAIKGLTPEQVAYILQGMIWYMDEKENWASSGVNEASRNVAEIFGIHHKKMIMPALFASLMGKLQGPPLFDSAGILGKDRVRARLLNSIEFLGGISNKKMDLLKKGWAKKDGKGLFASEGVLDAAHS